LGPAASRLTDLGFVAFNSSLLFIFSRFAVEEIAPQGVDNDVSPFFDPKNVWVVDHVQRLPE
jgi:predicted DNA-binding helix-hairpin-helix protein